MVTGNQPAVTPLLDSLLRHPALLPTAPPTKMSVSGSSPIPPPVLATTPIGCPVPTAHTAGRTTSGPGILADITVSPGRSVVSADPVSSPEP